MGLYRLKNTKLNIEDGIVERVKSDAIDYEKYFETLAREQSFIIT